MTERNRRRLRELDEYMTERFRVTFGNRIRNQIERYIPVYVGCGGEELEALSQDLSSVLSRMQDTIADLQVAFDETEEAFEDIQTLSYESVQPC